MRPPANTALHAPVVEMIFGPVIRVDRFWTLSNEGWLVLHGDKLSFLIDPRSFWKNVITAALVIAFFIAVALGIFGLLIQSVVGIVLVLSVALILDWKCHFSLRFNRRTSQVNWRCRCSKLKSVKRSLRPEHGSHSRIHFETTKGTVLFGHQPDERSVGATCDLEDFLGRLSRRVHVINA